MAIRPAFQFYPADWRNNAKLRRCSEAARGAWIDVLCILHDSDEYGVLRWPLADVAQAAGVPLKLLRELVTKGVLKGADSGAEAFVFTPRHGGKDGDPVTLVKAEDGPCWYCSRFVRDEYVRQRRGASTRFDTDNQPPKPSPKVTPKPTFGERQGDGASSSSSIEQELQDTSCLDAGASDDVKPVVVEPAEPPADPLWHTGLAFLMRKGVPQKNARSFLGKLKGAVGDIQAGALLAEAESEDITDPVPWLSARASAKGAPNANPVRLSAADRVRAHAIEGELADRRAMFAFDGDPNALGSDG
jgi:hypothetical protein